MYGGWALSVYLDGFFSKGLLDERSMKKKWN